MNKQSILEAKKIDGDAEHPSHVDWKAMYLELLRLTEEKTEAADRLYKNLGHKDLSGAVAAYGAVRDYMREAVANAGQ